MREFGEGRGRFGRGGSVLLGVVVECWEVEVGVVDGCEAGEGFEVVEASAADFG